MDRRLSAIFAADMVGYSRLMEADEIGTIQRQNAHRKEILDPVFEEYNGRIVKEMGDGLLVEFSSAIEAVQCAARIQRTIPTLEAGVPNSRQIQYRIGINLGDIIAEGDDIFGDGVNVAARLEQLADPGGICISGTVYDQMRNSVEVGYESLGEVQFKNIERPVRVYKVLLESDHVGAVPTTVRSSKSSIAVLLFENMSGDPDQEYFADGITEDIIIMLGRCRWLIVIARNSTFAYKGKALDVRAVARELGVRYVLEGTVRRSGDRVRITTQLSKGKDGANIFAERYDREIANVFDLQEEIAAVIAGSIEPELSEIEGVSLYNRQTNDLNAWESYQKGLWHLYRFDTQELGAAKTLFERSIELDAGFSQAHARLAYVYIQLAWYGNITQRLEQVGSALRVATQAVQIDGKDPAARLALGRAQTLLGNFKEGVEQLRIAVSLDPSFAQAHFALGQALTSLDTHEEAIHEMDISILLSPRDPHLWTFYHVRAIANYIAGNLEQAEIDEYTSLRHPNVTFYPYTVLVPILAVQSKFPEAGEALEKLRKFKPGFSVSDAIDEWHFGGQPIMTPRFMAQFEKDFSRGELGQ
jgi:TolB-like protein/class 3 adenylate cyclase